MKKDLGIIALSLLMASCAKTTYTYTVVVKLKDGDTYTNTLEVTKRSAPELKLKDGCFWFDGQQLVCGATSFIVTDYDKNKVVH